MSILLDGPERNGSVVHGWAFSVSTWGHLLLVALLLYLPALRPPLEKEKSEPVTVDVARELPPKPPKPREAPEDPRLRLRRIPAPAAPPPAPAPSVPTPPEQAPPRAATATPPPGIPEGSSRPALEPERGGGTGGMRGPGEAPAGRDVGDGGAAIRSTLRETLRDLKKLVPAPGSPGGGAGGEGGDGHGGGLGNPRLAPSGFGFGNLVFEDSHPSLEPYGRQIYYAILRAWYSRLYATAGVFEKWAYGRGTWFLDHRARLRFAIDRSGQIASVAVETPSGCVPLDESAADALREVVLPPLPADLPRVEETVWAFFVAHGDIRNIRLDPELQAAYYGN